MKPIIAISIPTGIGADFGGYAGDFGHIARKFAKDFHLITNPNAVNGGTLSAITPDMSYLEGYLFDEFFKGSIGISPLEPYQTNKIGIIFDSEIPQNIINIHLNTLNALKMVQDIETIAIEYTKEPVGVEIKIENGISVGNLKNPDTLIESAQKLINKGAQAIAIVCYFNEDSEDINYENGNGIDPIGGIEAIISHLIAKKFKIPTAHAPAFKDIDIAQKVVNPKVSSELISSTYLPCIMQGLAIAPKIEEYSKAKIKNKDVNFLMVPYDALGSKAVLSCIENDIKVICVKNKTVLNITKEKLGINLQECIGYKEWLQKVK